MTPCDVMRCQKPGSAKMTTNSTFERFVCVEHGTAIQNGADWITDPDTHAVQMGADLPPKLKSLRRRRNEGSGQVFVIETDRESQDPIEILLTTEDRALIVKMLS